MTDIIMKSMISIVERDDIGCIIPFFFGFAIDDYKAKYNLTNTDLDGKKVFGGIIYENERNKDIASILKLCVEANYDMIIVQTNKANESQISTINNFFDELENYEELKNVYADRFVFVKIPNK